MKKILFVLFALSFATFQAFAETASEVPLTNPEILEPPSREDGISRGPDDSNGSVQPTNKMTIERMAEIVRALDENAQIRGRGMLMTIGEVQIQIVADPKANRMRAFSPFSTLDGVNGQELYRMMQANFDSALDARYAIAKGHLISTFIHPLEELQKDQFIEGLGQVVNLVKTYGSAYTSGAMTFGGGDSNALHRKLIDELLKKGDAI